jgi:mono/diheme cytochrome c family protein
MRRRTTIHLLLGVLCLPAALREPSTAADSGDLHLYLKGRFVYDRMCVNCHGRRGGGDGEWSIQLKDKPRDFRSGIFKFKTTPPGFQPTDDDLRRTIRSGIAGTAMPTFQALTDSEVDALIVFIQNLSSRWDDPSLHAKPVKLPAPPDWFKDSDARTAHSKKGSLLFQQTCIPCHGADGSGNGPLAKTLVNAWGHPIRPGNLKFKHHKSGDTPADLYRTIALGLDGTPMAGFREVLKPSDIWNLIAFIKSIESIEDVYSTTPAIREEVAEDAKSSESP